MASAKLPTPDELKADSIAVIFMAGIIARGAAGRNVSSGPWTSSRP
jgi:hypothetical protein